MAVKHSLNVSSGNNSSLGRVQVSFYLSQFFQNYDQSFPELPSVVVQLEEKIETNPNPRVSTIKYGELKPDAYIISIVHTEYVTSKGVTKSEPSSVFESLKHTMDREVQNYINNINSINPPLSIRLKRMGIDISSNKDKIANTLISELGINNFSIDFNMRIANLTNEDFYQLGSALIVKENPAKPFTRDQIISEMKHWIFEAGKSV